jgi:hypothetical protein
MGRLGPSPMTALYLLLILCFLAILGVAAAVFFRVKKKIGLPPGETQQIAKRKESGEPAGK